VICKINVVEGVIPVERSSHIDARIEIEVVITEITSSEALHKTGLPNISVNGGCSRIERQVGCIGNFPKPKRIG